MDRLTNMIKPKKIFMGEKDFQQLYLVKRYIEKKYKSTIISCKTIRDKNKLPLSSRNLLLKKKELNEAGKIINNLILFKKHLIGKKNIRRLLMVEKQKLKKLYKIKIEYLDLRNKSNLKNSNWLRNSNIFIAFYINKVRLIDNF